LPHHIAETPFCAARFEFHRGKGTRSSTAFLKEHSHGFSSAHLVLTFLLIVFLALFCAKSQNALKRDQSVLNETELAIAAVVALRHSAAPVLSYARLSSTLIAAHWTFAAVNTLSEAWSSAKAPSDS
jgi:hypothetical protein